MGKDFCVVLNSEFFYFNFALVFRQKTAMSLRLECMTKNEMEARRIYQQGNELAAQGRMEQAAAHFERALMLKPDYAEAQYNLGLVHAIQARTAQAVVHYERALTLRPDYPEAHHNLGVALHALGKTAQAVSHYERALMLQPNYTKAHLNLGIALRALGQLNRAMEHYERALTLEPNYAEAHNALGVAFYSQNKTEQAMTCYVHAIKLKPDYAEAHNNLGTAFYAEGKIEQAIIHYERALALKPDYIAALVNLGLAFAAQDKIEQAIVYYERALMLQPNYAEARYNLGNALVMQGKMDQAVPCYERVLSQRPEDAAAHANLGNALWALGQPVRAAAHCQQALMLQPDDALAHNNLGNALAAQGFVNHAINHYERALMLKPDYIATHSNILLMLNYLADPDPVNIFNAHLDFAKRWETPYAAPFMETAHYGRLPHGRFKIGYVSSDFKQHSVAYFIEPVLANHDRERFEIFCYSNTLQEDAVTQRLQSYADHWRRLVGVSDEQAAQQIRADQVDILVDLNGHTANNRLLIFARKPAPLQITWLGYPNTTGLSAMNYRLTDSFADPPGMTEHLHSEKLWRLPECFVCYQPPGDAPEVMQRQERRPFTFGSFNNMAKCTSEVLTLWAQILFAVPASRLILKNTSLGEAALQQKVRKVFTDLGIASERLELLGPDRSQNIHLERYRNIDIGLDPFPYCGATTTCEALWMGLPVITLAGKTHAGRVGVSQLSQLGLTELIAYTKEEYVATAVRLANNVEQLAILRKELRPRLIASSLTNGQRFTSDIEKAYLAMWQDRFFNDTSSLLT